jgi:leader peptidase (prepilin peptidase)/N-methyltransferase
MGLEIDSRSLETWLVPACYLWVMDLRALEPLVASPGAYVFVFVLGTLWGSFANVCIYRWPPTDEHPDGRSVVRPPSHCSACKAPIRWYDNVPLLSYLWLRGRCRACKVPFSPRYLVVELVTGALFAVAWWAAVDIRSYTDPLDDRLIRFAIYAAFCFVMVVITFIDLDHKLILDRLTYPSIAVFYGASLLLPGRSWADGLVGAAVGYGVVWLVREVYYRITRREGLGLGDGKLLAVVGALLGWRGVVVSLFGGSLLGSVIGIAALVYARRRAAPVAAPAPGGDGAPTVEAPPLRHTELPFGPFLAMAAIFYLIAEPYLVIRFRLLGG